MRRRKRVKHPPTPWPTFILQDNRTAPSTVLIWTVLAHMFIISMICKTGISKAIVLSPQQPVRVVYEQSYIDTAEDTSSDAPQHARYYGAHNQIAAQEEPAMSIDEDPTLKGTVLSQKINQTAEPVPSENDYTQPEESTTEESGRTMRDVLNKEVTETDKGGTIPMSSSTSNDDRYIALNRNQHRQQVERSIKQRIQEHRNEHVHIQKIRSAPAPLRKSETSVAHLGRISMNVQGSEFGEYEQRLLEAISYRWQLLSQRLANLPHTGEIIIKYTLNKDGTITDLDVTKYTTSYEAALVCSDSILSQSPQPEWSDGMIAKIGDKKEMMIRFIYY